MLFHFNSEFLKGKVIKKISLWPIFVFVNKTYIKYFLYASKTKEVQAESTIQERERKGQQKYQPLVLDKL